MRSKLSELMFCMAVSAMVFCAIRVVTGQVGLALFDLFLAATFGVVGVIVGRYYVR